MSAFFPEEHFALALGDINNGFRALEPPQRVSVADGAKNLILKRPGDAAIPWTATDTPYMVEPMNMLASRLHASVAFVGPAQSGKTAALGEGWITHAVTNDPGDMLIVQMTEAKAREYSKQRVYRAIEHSPKLKALLSGSAREHNTHDIVFKHGMWLRIAWPTVTNLSSTSYRYVFLTDLDRMPDDLDGEGDPYSLGLKRTTTFLSRGMCAVESSPGKPFLDPSWQPATPHEAPPTAGILGIYNRSDRRRWYWKCPDCRDWFEAAPGTGLFNLPRDSDLLQEVRTANLVSLAKHHACVVCPHCGSMLDFRHRYELNSRGRWLLDGQTISSDDEVFGTALQSTIAGFWLGGVAAAYQSWESLLNKYLQALREYALTGAEEPLRVHVNTDQAMPYMSRHLVENRGVHSSPLDRAEREHPQFICPAETRAVVVAVDVQGGVNSRFVVQAHAVGPYMEQWLIDRYEIKVSRREGSGSDFAPIDPTRYAEDWDILTDKILRATYRTVLDDREIRVKMLVVDSGGEDGATAQAYAWYRRIRQQGLAARVRLYKGGSVKTAPVIKETLVGNRSGKEKGDIKLLMCNPNLLSDAVDAGLKRETPGSGYIHFPAPKHPHNNPDGWVTAAFFDELTAEVRDASGTWRQIKKRNETFDLCRMIRVGMLALGLDKIRNWDIVPDWLKPLEQNSETISVEERRAMKANTPIVIESTEPHPVARAPRQRRAAVSTYLR